MSAPLVASMPQELDLDSGYTLRVTALDAATGAVVAGVNVGTRVPRRSRYRSRPRCSATTPDLTSVLTASGIDWTTVLVTGIPATIGAVCAGAALVITSMNRASLRTGNTSSVGTMVRETRERTEDLVTPSGDPIGAVAERAEHLSAADVALTTQIHAKVTNGAPPPPGAEGV
jgi:hypothetical protein